MNVLWIGDVVGSGGCEFVAQHLPALKKLYQADLVIANGENSADGNGITPKSADSLFSAGVDILTTGNHAFRRREVYDYFDQSPYLIRPLNYPGHVPGNGFCYYDMGRWQVCVVNLMGTVYLDHFDNPFRVMDAFLQEHSDAIVLVDFHAEATSEKIALGRYLDGRVAAVAGTHTHVQTADECIFPGGTGFITDLGMTGPIDSVLGVKTELAIKKLTSLLPVRFEYAQGPCRLCGVFIKIENKIGKTVEIARIDIK